MVLHSSYYHQVHAHAGLVLGCITVTRNISKTPLVVDIRRRTWLVSSVEFAIGFSSLAEKISFSDDPSIDRLIVVVHRKRKRECSTTAEGPTIVCATPTHTHTHTFIDRANSDKHDVDIHIDRSVSLIHIIISDHIDPPITHTHTLRSIVSSPRKLLFHYQCREQQSTTSSGEKETKEKDGIIPSCRTAKNRLVV